MTPQHLPNRWNEDHRPQRTPGESGATGPTNAGERRSTRVPFTPAPFPVSETAVSQADGQN